MKKMIIIIGFLVIFLSAGCKQKNKEIIGADNSQNSTFQNNTLLIVENYNGHRFEFYDNLWHTKLRKGSTEFSLHTHFTPKKVENISIIGEANESMFNEHNTFYVTFDPIDESMSHIAVSTGETNSVLIYMFRKKVIAACTNDMDAACKERPIVQCNSTRMPVIFFDSDDKTDVLYNDNCMIISGKGEEIVKATERMLFDILRIMEK